MKKQYVEPQLELVIFQQEEAISNSTNDFEWEEFEEE